MTLEPPSEEDTVVESSDSDSDFARVDLFKQQDFDQLGRRKLASAMNSARKGSKGLKQNIFDVNTEGDDKEDSKASSTRKTPQKSLQKDAELNDLGRFPPGKKNHDDQPAWSEFRKETLNDDNRDLVAAEEVERILEELKCIKQRISQIENDISNRISK